MATNYSYPVHTNNPTVTEHNKPVIIRHTPTDISTVINTVVTSNVENRQYRYARDGNLIALLNALEACKKKGCSGSLTIDQLNFPKQLKFRGTLIRNGKQNGMWTESGINRYNYSSALLITDGRGNRKIPNAVSRDTTRKSRHALIKVDIGDLIVLSAAYVPSHLNTTLIYKVTRSVNDGNMITITANYYPDAVYDLELDTVDILTQAITSCLYCHDVDYPVYVSNYKENYVDIGDINEQIAETEELLFLPSLKLLYTKANLITEQYMRELDKQKRCLVHVILASTYKDDKPMLKVSIYASIYNHKYMSSKGHREGVGYTLLSADDTFNHIDQDDTVNCRRSVSELLKSLATRKNSTTVTAFRRITNVTV